MIAIGMAKEIRRLLAEGTLSQRAIALKLGVGRGIVGLIARGQRAERRPGKPARGQPVIKSHLGRCRGCGARVFLPCLACRVGKLEVERKAAGMKTIAEAYKHVYLEATPVVPPEEVHTEEPTSD